MFRLQSYKDFLQEDVPISKRKSIGLQKVFEDNFPITDSRETALLGIRRVFYRETPLYYYRMSGAGIDIFSPGKSKIKIIYKA